VDVYNRNSAGIFESQPVTISSDTASVKNYFSSIGKILPNLDGGEGVAQIEKVINPHEFESYEDLLAHVEQNPFLAAGRALAVPEALMKGADNPVTAKQNGEYWSGTEYGGCAIWATLVCDTILGIRSGPVSKDEWEDLYKELQTDPDGYTYNSDVARHYFNKKGYCTEERPARREPAVDESRVNEWLAEGCDVKVRFSNKERGHIETVTGADDTRIYTNS
jgi:hypothetical protein